MKSYLIVRTRGCGARYRRVRDALGELGYYVLNHGVSGIPSYTIRHSCYRFAGLRIGPGSSIKMHAYIEGARIIIGANTSVGRNALLDGRGELRIGDNVSISPHVHIITASHDANSPDFKPISAPVTIEDYAWIGTRATILPGVVIGRGAVVATGAVVTKNVAPMDIVAGVPARSIGRRNSSLNYRIEWRPFLS